MIDSAVTDLPLPDSPTRPSVSPARISKLTSLTAGTGPVAVSKTVVRCSTFRRGSAISRRGGLSVFTEDGAERVGDFAHRRPGFDGGDDRRHEVGATGRSLRHRVDRGPPRRFTSLRTDRAQPLDLPSFHVGSDREQGSVSGPGAISYARFRENRSRSP